MITFLVLQRLLTTLHRKLQAPILFPLKLDWLDATLLCTLKQITKRHPMNNTRPDSQAFPPPKKAHLSIKATSPDLVSQCDPSTFPAPSTCFSRQQQLIFDFFMFATPPLYCKDFYESTFSSKLEPSTLNKYRYSLRLEQVKKQWKETIQIFWRNSFFHNQVAKF